jgi:hypothetical protein
MVIGPDSNRTDDILKDCNLSENVAECDQKRAGIHDYRRLIEMIQSAKM